MRGAAQRPVALALQGGGAHGAFTWGVLDELLQRDDLRIEALSGTSAGAMNAIVLAHGLLDGGPAGAREALHRFWHAVSQQMPAGAIRPARSDDEVPSLHPAAQALLQWTRLLSPYALNPLNLNPLRGLLESQIDFERLRASRGPQLFIAATNANTGQLRLFRRHELSVEAALASACLPMVMQAVEIDGEPYWDGGYAANPALLPLVCEGTAPDLLIVTLNPRVFGELPRTASRIQQRALEIGFNACFLHELRWLLQLQTLARQGAWRGWGWRRRVAALRVHVIEADEQLAGLPLHTKLIPHRPFLETLRDRGRAQAQAWLAQQGQAIGQHSSADLAALLGAGALPPGPDAAPA
ncbi:patatin-like phospholipase family protein [Azohydromonas sp. G-1-1-14]|uniref:Patatin-like phospholipase family protein n=1 Tax=Azohydromonas caseinilytica TaxID=2728836 RepID=A0A848F3L3_9BURK|nr:patatin-like phospholipase family protein [Azohydromonas caseinilytica]